MKRNLVPNLFLTVLLIIIIAVFLANCSSSKSVNSVSTHKEIYKWYKSHEWLNGLKLTPHTSINQEEFFRQYHKNNTYWDKAFEFLKTHNLSALSPGSYVIDTGNVIASVSEVAPKDMNDVNWEAHLNFNDLQYIIKGKAKMGIASISDPKAKVIVPYTSADNETFSVDGGQYYDCRAWYFFYFFTKGNPQACF